tara:strand:+ start:52 stop:879 length:828 start_codon:yes stop_codon:yes gene_type:complete
MNKLINSSIEALKKNKIPNAELDIRILLKHSSSNPKEIILSNYYLEDLNVDYFKSLVKKRLENQPISKIINKKFFWKDEFFVNSNVLDPRPETELIIEETIKNIDKDKKVDILDIGTGSGCLAVSIAKELPNSKITAIDISNKALEVAKKNINKNCLQNQIKLLNKDVGMLNEKFDIIVSNPPYISENDYKNLQKEIRKFEPKIALLGGSDGLDFYRVFANKIENLMKSNSYFICEIGSNQLSSCKSIFSKTNLILKKISKDIQKIDRTLTFFKI